MSQDKKLTLGNKIGYATGDMASNLIFQMITMFLMFFYTDVFGLSAAAVGTLFLVARIWDAVNDPIMGIIVDKTKTRWGKFRPYLVGGAIPLAIFATLTFTVPNVSGQWKIVYVYVTYIALGMSYTAINIPYSAMTSSLTQDGLERSSLSSVRMIFAVLGGLVVAGATNPLVAALGGNDPAKGYRLTMMIYSVIGILLFLICFATTKERYTAKSKQKVPFGESLKTITNNKPLLITTITFMLTLTASTLRSATVMYYFKYNLNRSELSTLFLLISILSMVMGMFFVPAVSKKLDKKNTVKVGLIFCMIGLSGIFFSGYDNIVLIFIFAFITGFSAAFPTATAWAMVPDTVEYAEWKTGIRAEGTIYSLYSFGQKLGTALGGMISGIVLSVTGYIANVSQTEEALRGILCMMTIIPILLYLLGFIMISFYPLSKKKYNEILKDLGSAA